MTRSRIVLAAIVVALLVVAATLLRDETRHSDSEGVVADRETSFVMPVREPAVPIVPAEFAREIVASPGGDPAQPAIVATVTLLGKVVDEGTQSPRSGIEVKVTPWGAAAVACSVTTDAKGEFRCDGLPNVRGLTATIAIHDGGSLAFDVAIPRPGELRHVFELRPSITLRGRVVDAETGVAVAGAMVELRSQGFESAARATHLLEARADGGFEFVIPEALLDSRVISLTATHEGYVRSRLIPRSATDAWIPLVRGAQLEVDLVGPGGEPLEGSVEVVCEDRPGLTTGDPPIDVAVGEAFQYVKSDAMGRARFTGAPGREVVVSAEVAGHAKSRETRIRLGEAGSVTAHRVVLDAVEPSRLSGRLTFNGTAGPLSYVLLGGSGHRKGKADAAGGFVIEGLAPGKYRFTATVPGLTSREIEVELPPGGDVRRDVDLVSEMSRLGAIVMRGGVAVEGAAIFVRDPSNTFRVGLVSEGNGKVLTNVPCAAGVELIARIAMGESFFESTLRAGIEDQVIELPGPHVLRLVLVDAQTERPLDALPHLRIRSTAGAPNDIAHARDITRAKIALDAEGRIEIVVAPGTYEVEAARDAGYYASVRSTLISGEDPAPIVLRVPRAILGTVIVERVDHDPAATAGGVLAVPGTDLWFRTAGGDPLFRNPEVRLTRILGPRVREYRLPAGRLELGFAAHIEPPPAPATTIDLAADAEIRLRVRVVAEDG
jgi:hypothetical protein